ncbi:MAG: asparagine synthase (glutamine-hydrolyzing) [Thermoanaerobaculia bacterium]|nr:asparagine synthase (glutamine-hydrolyzing) [Thermoanaerobaculia bacterium]
MCGIAGLIHPLAGTPDAPAFPAEWIRTMTERLAHRGPDGEGYFEAPGVALGHRRLAVVDLETGDQPMASADGSLQLIFNGEIYNHLGIRAELEDLGYAFRTQCDTEVLVHGFRAWGASLVGRLEGQFAFAIWDATEPALWIFRDRMGQKPLFYARLGDGSFAFASEAKALVSHPDLLPAAVDVAALASYLTYEYFPDDLCIFQGVTKLPAGHSLCFRTGGDDASVDIARYWDLPVTEVPIPWDDAVGRFTELFDRAVERRLMADVPLGIFLSGGLDSSAVAASVVRCRPPESVDTFSIGFDDPSFDESMHARQVAEHLGTRHHEQSFAVRTLREVLPRVVEGLDEPFGDASLLPTFLLSEFTRSHVTVALGGDGGDELLLGYPTFQAERAAGLFRMLPRPVRSGLAAVVRRLPVSTRNFSFDFVAKSFLRGVEYDTAQRHALWLGSVIPGSEDDPLHPEVRSRFGLDAVLRPVRDAWETGRTSSDPLSALSYLYCKTYLAEDILHKVDRASMAVSLEARSPFLDRDLVEFLAQLPRRHKMRGMTTKYILKRAFAHRLPKAVPKRKKKGFGIPVARWFQGPLRPLLEEMLGPSRLAASGFFRPDVVERLVREHVAGRHDHRKILWTLLSFELWRDRYGIDSRS